MNAIRLLLVDDDPLVRSGLSVMTGGADDIEIAAEPYMGIVTVKTHGPRFLAELGLDNRVRIALSTHDAAGFWKP